MRVRLLHGTPINLIGKIVMEKVIASAIKFYYLVDSKYPQIWTDKRHSNIFNNMASHNIHYNRSTYVQGFWTSENRFVDRIEAKKIAVAANQLIVPIENTYPELFSEDVW